MALVQVVRLVEKTARVEIEGNRRGAALGGTIPAPAPANSDN